MRNSVSGSWQAFWKTDTAADYEIRYSYYNEDTEASGSHGFLHARHLSSGPRLVINMMPGYVRLREYDGSSWTTRGTGWVTTEEATWYDVYAKLNGSNVEVWWGEKGGALSKIIDTSSVNLTTTERFRFEVAPAAQFRYDDIVIFSDGVKSMTTFTHNDANEQTAMTVDGTTTNFAYDAWGRMTSRTRGSLAASMKYRYGDRLYEVTSNFPGEAAAVEFNYDGMGLRRAALVNGTDLTWWRWNGMSVYSEHEVSTSTPWDIESGDTIKTHFPGLGYAEPSGGSPMVTFKFYTTDHLGSVRGIWDGEWGSSVNNLATYDYTPYGDILQQSGLPLDVGFTGHHWDNHIQQYFAPFRFYNPTTLRWNMRDPLGFIDGPNVYAYVGGNPVMFVDPFGLSAIFDDGNIIGAFCNGAIDGTLQLLDTFIPIANPFNSLYDPNAPGMKAGKWGAHVGTTALGFAAGGGAYNLVRRPFIYNGNGWKFATNHAAHHTFRFWGKKPHLQLNRWTPKVKGSHNNKKAIRIPWRTGILELPFFTPGLYYGFNPIFECG